MELLESKKIEFQSVINDLHNEATQKMESTPNIYDNLIKEHSVSIKITQIYVKQYLKNIINAIKNKDSETVPRIINLHELTKNIVDGLPKTMEKDKFDNYIAEYLIAKSSYHYYYDLMASRIAVERLHNITPASLLITAKLLQQNLDKNGDKAPILADDIYNIILQNHEELEKHIDYNKDFTFDYFGIKTLERSYLYKLHFTKYKIIERPQHMIMRVALGIHGDDIKSVIETYELMSSKYFTHATPTLFNAGTHKPQMSSCFLQSIDDNIESIFNAVSDMSKISKWAGGIGVHLTAIRGRGSLIRGTNGLSQGIIPLCILLNKLAKYINQGGKRNGSVACYLEPWHTDIFEFCELRKDTGNDDNRARDLFLALWTPSLFMERVRQDKMWSLMCPDECKGLNKVYGKEFNELYETYEKEKKYTRQVKARELWKHILEVQSETGFPYILYKDNANAKSNQKNLGTIRSSNLCAEIIQYSDENETAVCNLASICLPMFVSKNSENKPEFNHVKLQEICRVIVRNIDKIIDKNYYPTEKTKKSNFRHRPMGIGVQGLADTYNLMGFGFSSQGARELNKRIFETIYYACCLESNNLAKTKGTYETFAGSPFSEGKLQYHLWGFTNKDLLMGYDWDKLVEDIKTYGMRNSLLTALMPTASTAQIMGNSECIEPYMSNIFKRSTLAGEFIVVNKNLMKELIHRNLWDDDMRKRIIIENGSIKNIEYIPKKIRNIYETAFEIGQNHLVKQSAERGKFIDQAQSFNLFMAKPNFTILTSALFEGHDLGNKTGMYYYRSLPAINPINFGIDIDDIKRLTNKDTISEYINSNSDDENVIKKVEKQHIQYKWKTAKLEDCLSCGS
uniref:ribonucleoside-diphosphate reductase n=1 Tax=viral metagenome TaxID=1070528 RepID=A0A6C0DXS0_9ZZZZ